MTRIAIVGAGGFAFPITMCRDIFAFEELAGSEIRLMDISEENNRRTLDNAMKIVEGHHLPAKVSATTDLERALDGVGYVIVT